MIHTAINSVMNQSYKDWELIVIDDGSTDNTKSLVTKFKKIDNRISYFFQKNQERSVARNNGITKSTGDWICFLDSDSEFLQYRISNLFDFICKKKISSGVINTNIFYKNNEGIDFIHYGVNFEASNVTNELIKKVIGAPQLCIKKEILEKDQFNKNICIGEDTELLLRIASKKIRFLYLNEITPSVIENIHENRSVYQNFGNAIENRNTWNFIFRQEYSKNILNALKREKKAKLEKNVCIYYINVGKNRMAIKAILKSAFFSRKKDFMYRINLLIHLLFLPWKVKKLL